MGLYPVYRLLGGHVMCQQGPGHRWVPVEHHLVDEILKKLDGVSLRTRRKDVLRPLDAAKPLDG
jgi:hypothetical protein